MKKREFLYQWFVLLVGISFVWACFSVSPVLADNRSVSGFFIKSTSASVEYEGDEYCLFITNKISLDDGGIYLASSLASTPWYDAGFHGNDPMDASERARSFALGIKDRLGYPNSQGKQGPGFVWSMSPENSSPQDLVFAAYDKNGDLDFDVYINASNPVAFALASPGPCCGHD